MYLRPNKGRRKNYPNLTPNTTPPVPPTLLTTPPPIINSPENRLRNKIRRQKLKRKIIQELKEMKLERQQNLKQKLQHSLYNDISNNIQDKTGSAGGFFNQLSGDLSLSRKDFIFQLTTWFRRSIWFLGFTAAYTVSPTLLGISVNFYPMFLPYISLTIFSFYILGHFKFTF